MIPLQLTLKNFLSYQSATLDFRGLHVACICGANGAGKSSLLEAIAWAIWGESRALTEDDMIHQGSTEALVDFVFQCHQQTYRIIRARHRGQSSTLEFQVQTPNGFRALTERGLRATQQLILQHLKLDYETFINSAYLRQGRADEFMLKRPSERKQILADLLKLDQYDALAEQSKDQARDLKAEVAVLERTLETITAQLQQESVLRAEQTQLQEIHQQNQQQQTVETDQLRQLQVQQQQRQGWEQQLALHQQQQQHLRQDCQRWHQETLALQQQQQQLAAVLTEADLIQTGYAQLQQLQTEEETQTAQFQIYQSLQTRRQQLKQMQAEQVQTLKNELRQAEAQRNWLQQQQQEIQHTLNKAAEVENGLEQLRQARTRLQEFDQLQMQVTPLMQRRQQVQTQLDRTQARLLARLDELQTLRQQLEAQQQSQTQIQQSLITVTGQIEYLEQQRIYQQQVREKGVERRTFMERLQEQQRKCERELAELDHKLLMLQQDFSLRSAGASDRSSDHQPRVAQAAGEVGTTHDSRTADTEQLVLVHSAPSGTVAQSQHPAYPPCPLCTRPLDELHWQVVLQHHQQEKQDIQDQLWVIREQLTTSDREIRILRQEYREVEQELTQYGAVLERRGKLQEQLQGVLEGQQRLQQVMAEQAALEQALHQENYDPELQAELRLLTQSLHQFCYDDRDHALTRGQVDRWRWAEIKSAELRQAQRKQAQLAEQQPQIVAQIAALHQQLEQLQTTPLHQELEQLDQQLLELNYDPDTHTALRQRLRQAQSWQLRHQTWLQAQQQYPQVQQRLQELTALWQSRSQAEAALNQQITVLIAQLDQLPNLEAAIAELDQRLQQRRSQLDQNLADLGRLQQQLQQITDLKGQQADLNTQLQTLRRQARVYQELAQAFGKNGIQALMIENVLPQLEAETNQILGRLSANQLHVQFVTQRASRKTSAAKLIDTLDILISDGQGTRPYETYSGGEAFRVNFAIRLALARLLAQRSGLALQLLIIDEGFGTQDEAGCDRLIGAINAIAADFACILTVTHIPHLKEAFQTRIEVYKTEQGSKLQFAA